MEGDDEKPKHRLNGHLWIVLRVLQKNAKRYALKKHVTRPARPGPGAGARPWPVLLSSTVRVIEKFSRNLHEADVDQVT